MIIPQCLQIARIRKQDIICIAFQSCNTVFLLMKNSPITEIWRRAASIIAKIIRAIIPLDLSFNKTVIFFQGNCFLLDKTLFNYEVTSPQMKTESYVLYSYLYKIIIQCWHLHFPPCYDPISASWNDLLILDFVYAAQSFYLFYDTIIIVNIFDKLRVWNRI